MKILFFTTLMMIGVFGFSQKKLDYKVTKNEIKVTRYYVDGSLRERGFYDLNKKIHGKWIAYNKSGEPNVIGYYKHGKKDGDWIFFTDSGVITVVYKRNHILNTYHINRQDAIALK